MRQTSSVLLWLSICWIHCNIPLVHSSTSGPCINVRTRTTFFFGEQNPATLSLSVRYFLTSFMKVSAFFLSPWKRGGSFPMALTLAAAATGCSGAVMTLQGHLVTSHLEALERSSGMTLSRVD